MACSSLGEYMKKHGDGCMRAIGVDFSMFIACGKPDNLPSTTSSNNLMNKP